jgi:hypothetical protein
MSTRALIVVVTTLLLSAAHAAAQSGGDASVTMSDAPDPVEAGGEITITITVGSGPGTATKVQLQSAVPAQTTPVQASSPGATCEAVTPSTTVFNCDLGTIPEATSKTVTIVVRTADSAMGTVTTQATVTAEADPNQSNNTASTVTTVTPPSPPPEEKLPPFEPIPEEPLGDIPEDTLPPLPGPAAPDANPPGEVSGVRATGGDRSVAIRWRLPSDSDLAHVVITRSAANTRDRVVYIGRAQDFVDRGVRNGTLYVYELRAVDRSGNSSEGIWVAARPRGPALFSPRANARLSSPPMLRWVAVPGASYYNVQLYRGSRKVLSAWPRESRLGLRTQWRFGGRSEKLLPGAYRWFVWPGRGPRSRSRYGPLLGRSSFVIVPPTI